VAGMWLGTLEYRRLKVNQGLIIGFLLFFSSLFLYYPIDSSQTLLIAGNNRLLFSALSIGICFCFFMLKTDRFLGIEKAFGYLGEISYSVYLLHPFCHSAARLLFGKFQIIPPWVFFIISILITLFLSFLCYQYFEKPLIRLGKTIDLSSKKKK
jgi:peptidoglycan/LPS O-acetylase OafA/YrhL